MERIRIHITKPLELMQATGLEVGRVEKAGETIWSVEGRARRTGVAQTLKLVVP